MDEVRARDYLHYPFTPFKQLDETVFLKSTFLEISHSFFAALSWGIFTISFQHGLTLILRRFVHTVKGAMNLLVFSWILHEVFNVQKPRYGIH